MKIAIISDMPNMNSGYGRISRYLGYYLSKNNDISYVGLQHRGYPVSYKFRDMDAPIYSGIALPGNQHALDRSLDMIKPDVSITIRDPVTFDRIRYPNAFTLSGYKGKMKRISYVPAMSRYMPVDVPNALMESTDHIVTYTDAARIVYMAYGVPYNIMDTVNIGYDNDIFYPGEADYFGNGNVFSFVGLTTTTRKRVGLLMKAFREYLYKYDPTAKLYIHGIDMLAYDVNAYANMLGIKGHIIMPQHLDNEWGMDDEEMADIYRSSRAVLSFSPEEGFNMPFLESMACGTPVVGNDSPFYDWSNQIIKVPSIESEEGATSYGYVSDTSVFADYMSHIPEKIDVSEFDPLHWDMIYKQMERLL